MVVSEKIFSALESAIVFFVSFLAFVSFHRPSLVLVQSYRGRSLIHPVFGKLFSTFDLYSGNTECSRWNRLALAAYYGTLYVSVLFEISHSGGFHTFHSVLSFSVSMIFGRLSLYGRPYCLRFFSQ